MNVKLYPAWKELLEQAKQWDYGSLHSHEEIENIICVPKGESDYYSTIQRANKDLLTDCQKYLRVVVKIGYRVIKANEHVSESSRQTKLANKRIKKAIAVAVNTNTSLLNEQESHKLTEYLARAASLSTLVDKGSTHLARISAGRPQLPKLNLSEDDNCENKP